MSPRRLNQALFRLVISILILLAFAAPALFLADQAQYFWDELGRLVGVIDGNGDVAVYQYDAVGNLLASECHTAGATGLGIFLVAPGSARVGTEVQIQGFGFSPTVPDNHVAFNGVAATQKSVTTRTIVARGEQIIAG